MIEKREGWILAGVYADEGTSGTVKKKRDGFLRLLQDCEAGKIDMLLTKSISRFARYNNTEFEKQKYCGVF